MASASSSSARHLFSESKHRLADRVNGNVKNIGSIARQIVRGSKSSEILMQTAKNFAQIESTVDNSAQNLRKSELVRTHIGYQFEEILKNTEKLEYVKEQVCAMER